MILESFSKNLLKLFSAEGFPGESPKLSQFLKLGDVVKATVIESFPKKNKAIIEIADKRMVVESQQSLSRVKYYSGRAYQSPLRLPMSIKMFVPKNSLSLELEDKTNISTKHFTKIGNKQGSNKKMKINPHQKSNIPEGDITKAKVPQVLKKADLQSLSGKRLEADVVYITGEKNGIVKIKNRLMTAFFHSFTPKPGEKVSLVVTPFENSFRLVAQKSDVTIPVHNLKNKTFASLKEPLVEMIQKIETLIKSSEVINKFNVETSLFERIVKTLDLLKNFSIGTNVSTQDSILLKEQIDLSGINYESKVKEFLSRNDLVDIPKNIKIDLKGQLIKILDYVEKQIEIKDTSLIKSHEFIEIIKVFRCAVENIEFQQLKNHHARQENQPVVLQIPDPFISGKTIKLYLKQFGDEVKTTKNKTNEGVILVFLLELSTLGNLRINAKMSGELVSLRIDVENQNIANYVNSNLNKICVRLGELGFEANASCCVLGKVDDILDTHLGQLVIDDYEHLVDLTT